MNQKGRFKKKNNKKTQETRSDVSARYLTLTMSAGVPMNPPVNPAGTKPFQWNAPAFVHSLVHKEKGREAFTSESSQQDLLVEGHGPLALCTHQVPHRLIDGEPGERVGHLEGGVSSMS